MRDRNPVLLSPSAKDYLWGGSRLREDFNLDMPVMPFAEAWVCSTHPDGQSTVVSTGENLGDVLKRHPEWLGSHAASLNNGELPILIKLIDAKKDLSVQVHPDDKYAAKHENTLGKTEMWYVLDANQESSLIYGFNRDVNQDQVRNAIQNKRVEKLLNHVSVKKNDLYFIEAGTVHAIGGGCLIAEIQENSNLTYRLYDYDRSDKNGNKRELHIDKALAVANMKSSAVPRQPMRILKYKPGFASELLTRCKYFQVERILLNSKGRESADFKTESNSFHVLLCVEGSGTIFGEDVNISFQKGNCIFVPAESEVLQLEGQAQILNVSC